MNFRAKEFIPERWTGEDSSLQERQERHLVVPFGVGKRICPGKKLAEQVLHILLARMFKRFDVGLVGEEETAKDEPVRSQFNFLLAPAEDLRFTLRERQ